MRAMTPQARDWHSKLAEDFAGRAAMALPIALPASTAAYAQ